MALSAPVFFDTTILLGGLIELLAEGQGSSQELMDAVVAGRIAEPCTAWHCCLEFFSVATRLPEEYRLDPADARFLVEEEVLPRFRIHGLPAARRRSFFGAAATRGSIGGRIYDFHIGSVALAAGTQVFVTENSRHFRSLSEHGIRVLNGAEVLAELA